MSRRWSCHQFCSRLKRLPVAGMNCHSPEAWAARVGHRVERTFYHGQQCEFSRHAANFDFFDDVMHVGAAAFHHAAQRIRAILVILLVMQGQIIVQIGHRKAVADAYPQVCLAAPSDRWPLETPACRPRHKR
jgi:hypothetical protein